MKAKLSHTSKLPCPSWSLPAWHTCPGAKGVDGKPVEACTKCYALQGRYLFPNVRESRDYNRKSWQRSGWVDEMIELIKPHSYFRWFDSGDIYNKRLAQKILVVCASTPATRHWIPTRSWKIPALESTLAALNDLGNVVVRSSEDKIDYGLWNVRNSHRSMIITDPDSYEPGYGRVLCTAYRRQGKCGPCRACWSKRVHTIQYPIHGGNALPQLMRRRV